MANVSRSMLLQKHENPMLLVPSNHGPWHTEHVQTSFEALPFSSRELRDQQTWIPSAAWLPVFTHHFSFSNLLHHHHQHATTPSTQPTQLIWRSKPVLPRFVNITFRPCCRALEPDGGGNWRRAPGGSYQGDQGTHIMSTIVKHSF